MLHFGVAKIQMLQMLSLVGVRALLFCAMVVFVAFDRGCL